MFKGLTSDLTGSADICKTARNFAKLNAAAYLLPDEEIFFAFSSPQEEFAFTNEALILVKGENATTTRKLVERRAYRDCMLSDVKFETTGRVDRDCEIKFLIGSDYYVSIDIARKEEELVKGYYKVLLVLQREQQRRARSWDHALKSLDDGSESLKLNTGSDLVAQAASVSAWMGDQFLERNPRCYREVLAQALEETGMGKK